MRASQVQQLILVSPQGVSKLMDLLSDTREIIRNDVSMDAQQVLINLYNY